MRHAIGQQLSAQTSAKDGGFEYQEQCLCIQTLTYR